MQPSPGTPQQYHKGLLEACPFPLLVIDSEGKITEHNAAALSLTGRTSAELMFTSIFDHVSGELSGTEIHNKIFSGNNRFECPLSLRHKNNSYTDISFTGSVFFDAVTNTQGALVLLKEAAAGDDIKNENAEYYRALVQTNPDPVFVVNREGYITDVNPAAEMAANAGREKLIGSEFSILFTKEKEAKKACRKIFKQGTLRDHELTFREGTLTDVFLGGSVYMNEKGEVEGIMITLHDISALKKNERKLIRANKKAEKARRMAEDAMKAKQQFLSNMSHEIRTPMNSIIGFTKVIMKTELTEKQREYLSAIKLSGDTLIVLINDILDLAKVDAGKMTFERIPFRIRESVSAMLHLFETRIQEKNIRLFKEFDPSIPKVLVGDPVRLRQVVLNLISNAVKFTSHGSITMGMKLKKEDSDNATLEFSITDTGIGIPANKIDSVFEMFEQAGNNTTRLYGGTGLGLAIVKQLVENQGGNVWVKSEPGKGSSFGFSLTFGKTDVKIQTEAEAETTLRPRKKIKGIHVLVAEDNTLNQLLMKTILSDFGFTLDIAPDGKTAMEKLEKTRYDIVLMDLQMPGASGFEVTEFVRQKLRSGVPIIALTADVTDADVKKCKAVGMNDYVSKPVDDKLLYNKMLGLLRKNIPKEKPSRSKRTPLLFRERIAKSASRKRIR
jgi:PAS domain S-box-containing protein